MGLGNIRVFRLLVVILFILIPVYFFLMFFLVVTLSGGSLQLYGLLWYLDKDLVFYVIMPLVLSVPWFIFLILFKNNFADSFLIMHNTRSVITPRWTIFYALSSFFIVGMFILPAIAPIFSMFGFFVIAWRLFIASSWAEKRGRGTNICWFLILVILTEFPAFLIAYEGYYNYSIFQAILWEQWINYLPEFFSFLIVIFNAFTIGSLTRLISTKTSEFEAEIDDTTETNLPRNLIYLIQTVSLILFLALWLLQITIGGFFYWINLIINVFCLLFAFILIILSLIRGRSRGIRASIITYILIFFFAIVDAARFIIIASEGPIAAYLAVPSTNFIYWLTAMISIPAIIYLIFWLLCLAKSSGEETTYGI
ncbi:MAG: hypothetical protein EU549_03840 [Promethearchaeota archaeon]|nr:MAG: hypothetical protein EU549_03840 [Candidatus Lokiarchaeota archaeon]